jgi:predicted GIY-YIG superfamily endonuclease
MYKEEKTKLLRFVPQYLENEQEKYCYTYILRLNDNKYYCGITKDLFKRLEQHKSKKSIFTSRFRKVELIGAMVLKDRKEAAQMEKLIKGFGVKHYATSINLDFINGKHEKSNIIYWQRL